MIKDQLIMILITLGTGILLYVAERGINALKELAAAKLPAEQARQASAILDTIDKIAIGAVQAFNSSAVVGLKASGAFTPEVQAMVKKQVTEAVIANLGPLKDEAHGMLGDVNLIIEHAIEKAVLDAKEQVNALVEKAKTPA